MDVIQPLLAVILVLALLCGALFLLRNRGAAAFRIPRLSPAGSKKGVEVIERVALGPQHALHVVRIGVRFIVVATTPTTCGLLCDLPVNSEQKER